MPTRITVAYAIPDGRAAVKRRAFAALVGPKVAAVRLADSYLIDAPLSRGDVVRAAKALTNPVMERSSVGTPLAPSRFDWAIEIGFKPGVTDNIGTTAKETIEDLVKRRFTPGEAVYASQLFFIQGKIAREDAVRIADSLHNPLIQRATVKSRAEFARDGGMGDTVPRVKLASSDDVSIVDLEVSDEALAKIGKEGIANPDGTRRGPLALDLDYLHAIRDHFRREGRNPTDIELESIAQTWSEHCKHTIFANPIVRANDGIRPERSRRTTASMDVPEGIYRRFIKGATKAIRARKGKKDVCVSVFTDNSGAIAFDEKFLVTHKVETHNSPSALDPFGGAITGIVGVNRDALGFGLGAKPIANVYGFCVGYPDDRRPLYRDAARTQKMLSARRILDGVVAGVNAGGNCSGIPTPHGFLFFDPSFRGKPLVFAGTVGLIPRRSGGRKLHEKRARAGDYIVMAGGRVGLDGIHGATFSSVALDAGSPATAVQIGDPITQKKMSDAIVREARDQGLYTSITDDGAGGLSCSIAEMARECGGCRVDLEKVPLKYPGLAPWQTWISESQERMTLSVPKAKWKAFHGLMARRGVEATVVGEFTSSGRCVVQHHGKTVMDVDLEFLHDGLPAKRLEIEEEVVPVRAAAIPPRRDHGKDLLSLLASWNLASTEFVVKQYDHEVQASSVLKPLQGAGRVASEAAAIRPVLGSSRGVIISSALYPRYAAIDTYAMAAAAIDGAVRAAVAAGADIDTLALLDNFCWASSRDPKMLGKLLRASEACYDHAVAYGTPFISGKDSMFNDWRGYDEAGNALAISALPTLLISAIGVVPDVRRAVSLDLKRPDDLVYLVGETHDEFGGSEYGAMLSAELGRDVAGARVPKVDAKKNRAAYAAFGRAVKKGIVASAIAVSRGGLAAALAKSAMGGRLGVEISLKGLRGTASSDAAALFAESQGRIVLTIAPQDKKQFEAIMKGVACVKIGAVAKDEKIRIRNKSGKMIVNLPLDRALKAYKGTFKDF